MSNVNRPIPPSVQVAPWGQPAPVEQPTVPEFADPVGADTTQNAPIQIADPTPHVGNQSIFDPAPAIPGRSVFAPVLKEPAPEKKELLPLSETDPSWLELVQFCQRHGNDIIQARYPQPRGECIDTIYRGVTVFAHPLTQVRHKVHGWIDWQDAIY